MKNKAYLYLFSATCIWGLQPIMMKILLQEYTTITVVFIRCMLMIMCYFSLMYFSKKKIILPTKKQLFVLIIMGFCCIPLNNIAQFEGLRYTTAIHCALLGATVPTMTAIFAYFILREKLNGIQWIGIFISFLGVLLMLTRGNIDIITKNNFNIGDILIIISEIGWALYIIFGRQIMQELSPLITSAWASLSGTLMLVPYTLLSKQLSFHISSIKIILVLIFVVVFSGVLATIIWNMGVNKVGASKSSIFSNVTPFTALIFSNFILNEQFYFYDILGMIFVCIGVYVLINLHYGYFFSKEE